MAALEREVGARLFRRPGGPAVPTAAGEAFLAAAPAVLEALASARSAVGADDAGSSVPLVGPLLCGARNASGP